VQVVHVEGQRLQNLSLASCWSWKVPIAHVATQAPALFKYSVFGHLVHIVSLLHSVHATFHASQIGFTGSDTSLPNSVVRHVAPHVLPLVARKYPLLH
jgi:hypothetical protein